MEKSREPGPYSEAAIQILDGDAEPISETMTFIVNRASDEREHLAKLLKRRDQAKKDLDGVQQLVMQTVGALRRYQLDVELMLEREQENVSDLLVRP